MGTFEIQRPCSQQIAAKRISYFYILSAREHPHEDSLSLRGASCRSSHPRSTWTKTSSINMRQRADSLSRSVLASGPEGDNHGISWIMTYHDISARTWHAGHVPCDAMRQGTAIGRACVAFADAAAPWIAAATVAIGRPGLRRSAARQTHNDKHRAMISYDIWMTLCVYIYIYKFIYLFIYLFIYIFFLIYLFI